MLQQSVWAVLISETQHKGTRQIRAILAQQESQSFFFGVLLTSIMNIVLIIREFHK